MTSGERIVTSAERILRGSVACLAVVFVAVYGITALMRMAYPYELEWMEGGVLDHVNRLLHGQAIYVRPTLEFVPFPYTPLYYVVASAVSAVFGPGFMPLRLVSFVSSLGVVFILYRLVALETDDRIAPVLAAGTFAATYRLSGAWMDLARPDSLFLFFFWAGIYAVRIGRGWTLAAGPVAFCLAFLTKQAALPMMIPVFVWLVWRDRRSGLRMALATAALLGLTVLVAAWRTDGWFVYYVFSLPARDPSGLRKIVDFVRQDLLGHLGITAAFAGAAFLLPHGGRERARIPFHAAVTLGAVGGSFLMRIHPGGFLNTLLPAYSAMAFLLGIGFDAGRSALKRGPEALAHRGGVVLVLAVLLQLASLAADPRSLMTTRADERGGNMVVGVLRDTPGDVLVWSHPYLLGRAGKPGHAHELAVSYVIDGDEAGEGARLRAEFTERIKSHRYAALIVDEATVMPSGDWKTEYREAKTLLEDPGALRTKTGRLTRPDTLWVPRR